MLVFRGVKAGWKNMSWYKGGNASLQNINFGVYPHGNQLIPFQVTFEDVFPFPKVGYVSSLEGISFVLLFTDTEDILCICIIMYIYTFFCTPTFPVDESWQMLSGHIFNISIDMAGCSSGWLRKDLDEWTYDMTIWYIYILYIFIYIFIYSILFIFMNTISNKQTSHHYILSELFQMSEARI